MCVFVLLLVCPPAFRADNVFTGVSTYEFEDSSDTTWTDNTGGGCLDGSTDFAEGGITEC